MALELDELDDPSVTFDPQFLLEECPISLHGNQYEAINASYPFHGIDPEDQPLDEFVRRKYLDTLWMPEVLMPLRGFIQELQRAQLHTTYSLDRPGLHSLINSILLEPKAIVKKYHVKLPAFLRQGAEPTSDDEKMVVYIREFEKEDFGDDMDAVIPWLNRFKRREAQIQLLLRLFLLSYPEETAATTSPRKRKRKKDTHEAYGESLEKILDQMNIWIMSEDEPKTGAEEKLAQGGWAGEFCEEVILPLFKDSLPGESNMCLFSLCPAKYDSPSSSALGSPNMDSIMAIDNSESQARMAESRSPSFPPSFGSRAPSPLLLDSQTTGVSGIRSRSLSRARSASVFSLDGVDDAGSSKGSLNINRGGIGTSRQIFRQVEMRKNVKEKEKPKPRNLHRTKSTGPNTAPQPLKREFSRSITVPLKANGATGPSSSNNNEEILLVAETPIAKRYRTFSAREPSIDEMDLQESPDAMLLQKEIQWERMSPLILVPETPSK